MVQILIHVGDDVAREVRRLVKERYGGRKGALSLVVEEALLAAISPPAEISASTMLEVIDYVSEASKEGRLKDEMLTNVYLMLDRQFEQSIVKGIRDAREGRYRAVPKGEELVEFLRKLAAGAIRQRCRTTGG